MKKKLFGFVFLLAGLSSFSQTFDVVISAGGAPLPVAGGNSVIHQSLTPITSFDFRVNGAAAGAQYNIFLNGANAIQYTPGPNLQTIAWPGIADLRGQNISVQLVGGAAGNVLTIQFSTAIGGAAGGGGAPVTQVRIKPGTPATEESYIKKFVSDKNMVKTQFGMQILSPTSSMFTQYTGKRYVHIFFDQYGNSVLGTVPQGISNLQYVVHVIYLTPSANMDAIRYVINQTSGEYNDAAIYRNTGILDSLKMFQFRSGPAAAAGNVIDFEFTSKEILFSTSTTNISFSISRLKVEDIRTYQTTTTALGTYTIKMAPVYAGSFDIGLISTRLENPNFTLVNSPANAASKVVKKDNTGSRGVVSVMATLYVSPFTILKSLINDGNVPWYKLTGRSFLDYNGNILERVFPSFGVGFTDKTFENLFFGANIEVARGGSVFVGYHYGKINTFDAPDNFEFGTTEITEDEFNLRKSAKWKGAFAIGANVDLRIILNLFRPGGSTQQ
jgi:hypothetical protein